MQADSKPFTNQKPAASANEATCSLVRYGYAAKRQAVRTRLNKRGSRKKLRSKILWEEERQRCKVGVCVYANAIKHKFAATK